MSKKNQKNKNTKLGAKPQKKAQSESVNKIQQTNQWAQSNQKQKKSN
jgi:hypothetical protein